MKRDVLSLKALWIFVFSYLLNFLWESVHAVLFYAGLSEYKAASFVKLIAYASFVDALIIVGIYFVGSLFFKGEWLGKSCGGWFTVIMGVLIAAIIEAKALYLHQWSYNDWMPTVAGLGVSPLIQLAATGLFVFYIISRQK